MIPLFDINIFNLSKTRKHFNLQCEYCQQTFTKTKKEIKEAQSGKTKNKLSFCSITCAKRNEALVNGSTVPNTFICKQCNIIFTPKEKDRRKFCSRSCSGIFNNKNKKYGTRRSKLEYFIEENLSLLFPNLIIEYNQKYLIGSELDILIPSLKLAFELNGIIHYQPIFGIEKLLKIQKNDKNKLHNCEINKIKLHIIDYSYIKNYNLIQSNEILEHIKNIILNEEDKGIELL